MAKRNKLWAGAMVVVLFWIVVKSGGSGEKGGLAKAVRAELGDILKESVYATFCPGLLIAEEGSQGNLLLQTQIDTVFPLYGYVSADMAEGWEDRSGYEVCVDGVYGQSGNSGQREGHVGAGNIAPGHGTGSSGSIRQEDYAGTGSSGSIRQKDDEGSGSLGQNGTDPQQTDGSGITDNRYDTVRQENAEEKALQELLREENEAVINHGNSGTGFIPHERQAQVSLGAMEDFDTLVNSFYIVDANTMVGSNQLDIHRFLEKDMRVDQNVPGPQILIFHTHSRETFADSRSGEEADTIVGVGEQLAEILRRDYGYTVLHHTVSYDAEGQDDAYTRALPEVEQLLKDNPSIQVVIDLHRDEMPEGKRLVMDLDGRPTARFMFFNGLSRTKKTGNISYLYNENLEANLAFSFQMQLKAAEYYPGLTRKIYLKGYRYNMHLKDKYLLIELGAQNNTLEEVMNACDPLAHILDLVLSGESATGKYSTYGQ